MMTKKTKTRLPYLAIALGVLLVITITFFILEKTGITNFFAPQQTNLGPSKKQQEEQKKSEQDQKQEFIENDNPVAPPLPEAESSTELTAKQEQNGSVTVLTKLYGISDGECILTITNGSESYSQTVPVIYQSNFSSCAGFTVQKDKLGAGEWTISLTPTSNSSAAKTIKTKVN